MAIYPVSKRSTIIAQKVLYPSHERVELIVMQPVARILKHGMGHVPEAIGATVLRRIGRPALRPPHNHRRRGNFPPESRQVDGELI